VGEHLLDRMVEAGVDRICFVIAPSKTEILRYFGAEAKGAALCYAVQPEPLGVCDAIFRALPFVDRDETVIVGLPDTLWFPANALGALPADRLSFLLFPVPRPELFEAVIADASGRVREIEVKRPGARSRWVWAAFRAPATVLAELQRLWLARGRGDESLGTLVNAYLAEGGEALAVPVGEALVDVGRLDGYREAIDLLARRGAPDRATRLRRLA
jgi:dTDP-glucose pyrophosphorylase